MYYTTAVVYTCIWLNCILHILLLQALDIDCTAISYLYIPTIIAEVDHSYKHMYIYKFDFHTSPTVSICNVRVHKGHSLICSIVRILHIITNHTLNNAV